MKPSTTIPTVSSRRRFLSAVAAASALFPFNATADELERRNRWEMIASDDPVLDPEFRPEPQTWDDNTITASWIGHSTVLINFFGFRILTDPVFSTRIGLNVAGLFTIGPKRLVHPALSTKDLPPIDLILLSHAHFDHLDIPTLREFDRSIPIIIAQNTYDVVQDLDFTTVYELDWGEWAVVRDLRIEALEVRHFGWRYPWEPDRSRGYHDGRSYNAYLLSRNGKHIVFGGDTSYHELFRGIKESHQEIALAIMPIGAYDPWIRNHANPEQALAMADHMGAEYVLPIHWRTFIQSEEPTMEPIKRLKAASAGKPERIVVDAVGQTWSYRRGIAADPMPGGAAPSLNHP